MNKVTKQLNFGIIGPVRMCIVCKNRFSQSELYRFQIINGEIVSFTKSGRSFYICQTCIESDSKRVFKTIKSRFKVEYKDIADFGKFLKELNGNV